MSPKEQDTRDWQNLRTEESRQIETLLQPHFESVDAYRFNSASLRLRIVDSHFKGKTREQRDDMVEPILAQLDQATQADIINLVLIYPGEEAASFRAFVTNQEFEHPLESML